MQAFLRGWFPRELGGGGGILSHVPILPMRKLRFRELVGLAKATQRPESWAKELFLVLLPEVLEVRAGLPMEELGEVLCGA